MSHESSPSTEITRNSMLQIVTKYACFPDSCHAMTTAGRSLAPSGFLGSHTVPVKLIIMLSSRKLKSPKIKAQKPRPESDFCIKT